LCGQGIASEGSLSDRGYKMVLKPSMGVNREKVPLFVSQSVCGKQDSTNYHQKLFSADFEHTSPLVRRFLGGRRSMNPGQAPPDSGEPEERRRPRGHITPVHGNGQLEKNLGWKEKWMDSSSLAMTETYRIS